jgi:nucleoside-diphosphate-sugar epimerase
MRALVTGATGLVGSHLCERLAAEGWQVRALVRDPARAAWLGAWGVELRRGDTTDAESFAAAAVGCDVVFHAAAAITPDGGWEAFRVPNVFGTARAIDAARAAGARLLHVSSVAVYGGRARYETAGPVSEELSGTPLAPDEHYARSKRESEQLVLDAHRRGTVWATAIRPCVVYGRRDRQFVPRIARLLRLGVVPLLGGGRSTLPLVHAANVADAAVRAATCDAAAGRAFNVANDGEITFAGFVRLAGEGLGRRVVMVPMPARLALAGLAAARVVMRRRGGVMTMARASVDFLTLGNPFTSRLAYETLGWTPRVRHEDGVPDAFRWASGRLT